MSTPVQRRAHIQTLLADYLELPHTPTRARPPDRRLAAHFYDRAIPLATVQDAFLVATSRRLFRDPALPRLSPIRSLYYFLPIVEELLQYPLPHGYAQYLERKPRAHHKPKEGHPMEKPVDRGSPPGVCSEKLRSS